MWSRTSNALLDRRAVGRSSNGRNSVSSWITVSETNCLHLKMDGWNTSFLLGWPIFRGELLISGSVLSLSLPVIPPEVFTVFGWYVFGVQSYIITSCLEA